MFIFKFSCFYYSWEQSGQVNSIWYSFVSKGPILKWSMNNMHAEKNVYPLSLPRAKPLKTKD